MGDTLDALERRADELEAFASCEAQMLAWLRDHTTDELVEQLRAARKDRRRVRLGTINTLVLLEHIDRLEAEISKEPLRLG